MFETLFDEKTDYAVSVEEKIAAVGVLVPMIVCRASSWAVCKRVKTDERRCGCGLRGE